VACIETVNGSLPLSTSPAWYCAFDVVAGQRGSWMDRSFVRDVCAAHRWLPVAIGSIVVGAIAGLVFWRCTHASVSACEREVRDGDRRHGIELCLASYARSHDEHDLGWAARAHLRLGDVDEAEKLAVRMLTGSGYGDAHAILSYVTLRRGAVSAARAHATIARVAHALAGDDRGVANDAISLSQAARQVGDYTAALAAADDALRLQQRLRDAHGEVNAQLARVDALRRMGDTAGAREAARHAIERATEPCDKAWAHLKNAMCVAENAQEGLALVELTVAARDNRRCGSHDIAKQVAMNEAWLLRWKDPVAALARLDEVASSDGPGFDERLLRGDLAANRGALAEAERFYRQAADYDPPDADWPWDIARSRAELSELRGGLRGDIVAEYYYRRAIGTIAALRGSARARSAYLVSSHRGPYDGLIALLARHGRWRDVLAVILELDASDMLRATADEVVARKRPGWEVGESSPSPVTTPSFTVDDVLAAWRSQELVLVIAPPRRQVGPGRERVYRLRIADGQITGEDLGDASAARKWADDLLADPGDRTAAQALGRVIVPPGTAERTLHVLAIGSLGKVPLAALRDGDGSLIVGRRPLVRVLALGATTPESRGAGAPAVIADPRGDLLRAVVEGFVVAEALGPAAQVSGSATMFPATRARLWAARDAELLHIAGHVGTLGRWRALHLFDGDVDPTEMLQQHLAPRIAVLAGCGSAAATDEEGWGSIAEALLESGTAIVIATDRSIRDDVSLFLMVSLYAQPDWRTDPARALARVQQALDARSATSPDEASQPRAWAAFSVLARPPVIDPTGEGPRPAGHAVGVPTPRDPASPIAERGATVSPR
jgi:tetratricopeptide (TPR) repeat protein